MDIEAVIELSPNFVPPKLRKKDMAIMDILLKYGYPFDDIQMQQINLCQLYLGVTYLSEIFNVKGTHLIEDIGDEDTSSLECTPLQNKIYQPYPKKKTCVICDMLLNYVTEPTELNKLISPLGDFTKDHSTNHCWNTHENEMRAYLFDYENSLWQQYNIHPHRQIQPTDKTEETISYKNVSPIEINMLCPASITPSTSIGKFPKQRKGHYIHCKL